jgi:hypothetical protein
MFRKRISQLGVAVLGVVMAGGFTTAQAQISSSSPASDVGGYAGRELQRIQSQSVGRGYTAGSLNQISMQNARAQVPNIGGVTSAGSTASVYGINTSLASKPFSAYSPAPTTSPYLNLFREDLETGGDLNYNTLVRPMLQQQRFNEQVQRQNLEINKRLQSIAAKADFNPQGSTTQYPTGHQTVFNYLGHYYPSRGRR